MSFLVAFLLYICARCYLCIFEVMFVHLTVFYGLLSALCFCRVKKMCACIAETMVFGWSLGCDLLSWNEKLTIFEVYFC